MTWTSGKNARNSDSKISYEVEPPGRRKHVRSRKSWQEGIDKIIQKRNLGDDMWNDSQNGGVASDDVLRYEPTNLLLFLR